jgi:DNA-3-methyladenine glycosylase
MGAGVAEMMSSLPNAGVVPVAFFNRPAAKVARDLIGLTINRSMEDTTLFFTITETEAYEGEHDLACHSAKGRTARTDVMFGPAGRFYIYRIYGLHWMLNIVTGDVNEAAAVLVRGVEGVNGPGRVAAILKVDASLNGLDAVPTSGLWFEHPQAPSRQRVVRTPRIGIDYAGPIWATKKLRFLKA